MRTSEKAETVKTHFSKCRLDPDTDCLGGGGGGVKTGIGEGWYVGLCSVFCLPRIKWGERRGEYVIYGELLGVNACIYFKFGSVCINQTSFKI